MHSHPVSRRAFSKQLGLASAAVAMGAAAVRADETGSTDVRPEHDNKQNPSPLRGTAEHVISIWLGGGMGQIDTFDPNG